MHRHALDPRNTLDVRPGDAPAGFGADHPREVDDAIPDRRRRRGPIARWRQSAAWPPRLLLLLVASNGWAVARRGGQPNPALATTLLLPLRHCSVKNASFGVSESRTSEDLLLSISPAYYPGL